MRLHDIKQIFRNINKNRFNYLIKIIGITLAIVPAVLIWSFIRHETRYEHYLAGHEKTFRVIRNWQEDPKYGIYTPVPLLAAMIEEFPEIESGSRVRPLYDQEYIWNENIYRENVMLAVDTAFFNTLKIKLLNGDPDEVLSNPQAVVISKSIAKRIFKDQNPIGKEIELDCYGLKNESSVFTISGTFEDFPSSSHLQGNFILPLQAFYIYDAANHTNHTLFTYLRLNNQASESRIEKAFPAFMKSFYGKGYYDYARSTYLLQPLTDIHLNASVNYNAYETAKGNYANLYIFPILALLIILIASFNFINLTVSEGRYKQKTFGINKLSGAGKYYFLKIYIFEALILFTISVIIAAVILWFIGPFFNRFVNRDIDLTIFNNPIWISIAIIIAMLLGILNGIYPALLFSSKSMIGYITNRIDSSNKQQNVQRFFQVIQFAICIFFIVGSLIVFKQLNFINSTVSKSMDKENVLIIKNAGKLNGQQKIFKSELKNIQGIENVSVCDEVPGIDRYAHWGHPVDSAAVDAHIAVFSADYDYLSTLKMELKEGRFFDRDHLSDDKSILLNETAVRTLGWEKNPIGKRYRLNETYTVIGVVKDIYFESLHHEIIPQGFFLEPESRGSTILVKLAPGHTIETLNRVNALWSEFVPERPMHYGFLDTEFSSWYNTERKTGYLALMLSAIAIFLSAFGLLALVLQTINNKIKEIGIRKVNGSQSIEVLGMLNKDFTKWVIVAFIVASPVAYYMMSKWLESFVYKTEINWWIFALAGLSTLGIALITVSWQSWKAASRNPVEALRYE